MVTCIPSKQIWLTLAALCTTCACQTDGADPTLAGPPATVSNGAGGGVGGSLGNGATGGDSASGGLGGSATGGNGHEGGAGGAVASAPTVLVIDQTGDASPACLDILSAMIQHNGTSVDYCVARAAEPGGGGNCAEGYRVLFAVDDDGLDTTGVNASAAFPGVDIAGLEFIVELLVDPQTNDAFFTLHSALTDTFVAANLQPPVAQASTSATAPSACSLPNTPVDAVYDHGSLQATNPTTNPLAQTRLFVATLAEGSADPKDLAGP